MAVGRRNWLFCGSDAGSERAAVLWMCRLHGVDPVANLSDVLSRLTIGRGASDYDGLMPQRWSQEKPKQTETELCGSVPVA